MTELLGGYLACSQDQPTSTFCTQTGSFIMLAHISSQILVHNPKSKRAPLFQNSSPFSAQKDKIGQD